MSKFRAEIDEDREIDSYLIDAISILDAAFKVLGEFDSEDTIFAKQDYLDALTNVKAELHSVRECLFLPCSQSLKDLDAIKVDRRIDGKFFPPSRVNRLQSYLASHWAIYEQIAHQSFILIASPNDIKNQNNFRLKKVVFNSKPIFQYRASISLLARYGWKSALSYCLRNAYLHESGKSFLFETNTPSDSSFKILNESWTNIRNNTDTFLKTSDAKIENMPKEESFMEWVASRDLLEILKECHHASDVLHGTLVKSAAMSLLTEIEILFKPSIKKVVKKRTKKKS